ncbi:hypothetical protein HOF92_14185 [bacterium]|jgi:hypothetical protein|nr:hypothetical protein [bacterium]
MTQAEKFSSLNAESKRQFLPVFEHFAQYLFCEKEQLENPARILCSSNSFTQHHPDQILIYHHLFTHILCVPFPLTGLMTPIAEKLPPYKHEWSEHIQRLLIDRKPIGEFERFEDWYLHRECYQGEKAKSREPGSPEVEAVQNTQSLEAPSIPGIPSQGFSFSQNGKVLFHLYEISESLGEITLLEGLPEIRASAVEVALERFSILRIRIGEGREILREVIQALGFQQLFTWEILQIQNPQ